MTTHIRHLSLGLIVSAGLVHAAYLTTAVRTKANATGTVGEPSDLAPTALRNNPLSGAAVTAGGRIAVAGANAPLPPAVVGMKEAILEAVASGRLDDLKVAFDLNELKPELSSEAISDPVTFWRAHSADGDGADILKTLGILLELPFAVLPLGKDPENTGLYVWPAFADRTLSALTADEAAHLALLEPSSKAAAMRASGRYTGWRLVIGADGVWHSFRRYD